MNIPIAPKDLGKRVDSLLSEIAHLRDMQVIHLPQLLQVEPGSDHKVWLENARASQKSFANRKELPDSIVGSKLCGIVIAEFKTKAKWRKLLNRLVSDQLSKQIEHMRNVDSQASIQTMRATAIIQAQIMGSPDADKLVDQMMTELGIDFDGSDTPGPEQARIDDEKERLIRERRELEEEIELQKERDRIEELRQEKAEKKRLEIEEKARQELDRQAKQRELELKRNAAIRPGRWHFSPFQVNHALSGLAASEMNVDLDANGQFSSAYALNIMGYQANASIRGSWSFDYRQSVLSMNGMLKIDSLTGGDLGFAGGLLGGLMPSMDQMMPPQAYTDSFTITAGSGGVYDAYDSGHKQWRIEII